MEPDMEMLKIKFEEFIDEFEEVLLEEHYHEILRYLEFLKPYYRMKKVKSIYGEHYATCCWAKDTTKSGPDTCECCHVPKIIKRLEKLVHFYYRLRNKKCEDCILKKCFI